MNNPPKEVHRTHRRLARLISALLATVGVTLAGSISHAQPGHAPGALRTEAAKPKRSGKAPTPRLLIEQLQASFDAGDSFATPEGPRRLRRLPGVVALGAAGDRQTDLTALTRAGGALSGYTVERRLRNGIQLLTAPVDQRHAERRDPSQHIETLTRARQARPGVSVNPVFIDPRTGLRWIPTQRIVVRLEPGTDAALHFGNRWRDVEPLWGTTDQFILSLPAATAEEVFHEASRQSTLAGVTWAEPEFISQIVRNDTPNDPLFGNQWHLENSGQSGGAAGADSSLPGAWDISTGDPNIVIAIVDDGVQLDHPDLAANLFVNTGEIANNGFDDDGNGIVDDRQGYNFVVDLPDAGPYSADDNHGTAVAGLAAARGNNGTGTAGAAYDCRILPIKVLEGDYSATTSDFAKALRHVAGLNSAGTRVWRGADVVNISLTFGQSLVTDAALADVVTKGRNGRGCAVFVAAGNYASAWEPVEYEVAQAGTYTLRFEYSKDNVDTGAVGSDTVWIDSVRYPDGQVETFEGGLPSGWTTSGFSPWRVVTDGVSGNIALTGWNGPGSKSVRAGPITHGQTNYLEVTKSLTPGKVVFWTWVSSEYGYDFFDFWVGFNGTETLIFSQSGVPIPELVVSYPANNANTIAVGASTDFDYRADYSQYGTQLDFVAPSDGGAAAIVTTDRTGLDGYNSSDDYTADFGGTSAASPLAAGVAALALSVNPYLTSSDIRSLLRGSCSQIGDVSYDTAGRNLFYGSGRLNAGRAVAQSIPNLRVTLTPPEGPINSGDSMTYSILVRNIGFSRSGIVTLTNQLPAGATLISASPTPASQSSDRLTFTNSGIIPGATWTITVTVTAGAAGTQSLIAGASTDVPEPSTSDNIASGSINVLPLPEISIAGLTTLEGNSKKTNLTATVTLSNPSSKSVTVTCVTVPGTASARSDFTPRSTRLTFPPGETNASVVVSVVGDTRNEADESFTLELQSPSNAILGVDTATITILNDDSLPVLAAPDVVRKEGNSGAAKAVFKFKLSAPSGRLVTVDYATVAGSAQSGIDFLPTNGVLTFLPGKTAGKVTVLVPGDKSLEADETFFLALSNPVDVGLVTNLIACTIVNNDKPPKVSLDDVEVPEMNEGTNLISLTVRLAIASELPVTLNFATTNGTAVAGSDYVETNGVVTFAPGETNQTLQIGIVGDTSAETTEHFFVRLSDPINATLARTTARVTISDSDAFQSSGTVIYAPPDDATFPMVLQLRLAGPGLVLRFYGFTGSSYFVESTSSLEGTPVWIPVDSVRLPGANAYIETAITIDPGTPQRFYRVRAE